MKKLLSVLFVVCVPLSASFAQRIADFEGQTALNGQLAVESNPTGSQVEFVIPLA